jgi:hypothetical protein
VKNRSMPCCITLSSVCGLNQDALELPRADGSHSLGMPRCTVYTYYDQYTSVRTD